MDGPPSPYREGKPLSEIIPPDDRRTKTAILIVASMVSGAALWVLGGWLLDSCETRKSPVIVAQPVTGYVAGRLGPTTLSGPDGTQRLPPGERAVIHVWLQGCADCMPAFEAMRDLESTGGLGVKAPVINVSYGRSDPLWAARYGVRHNLVFDHGGQSVVRPLGIGTFTTLVVDADGSILHRDRPDRPGYRDRVRSALGAADDSGETFDSASVERVVAAHRTGIKRACWERGAAAEKSSASVTVTVSIAADGSVAAASSTGDDPDVARCLEAQIKTWRFPRRGGSAAPHVNTDANIDVKIPFEFVRQ